MRIYLFLYLIIQLKIKIMTLEQATDFQLQCLIASLSLMEEDGYWDIKAKEVEVGDLLNVLTAEAERRNLVVEDPYDEDLGYNFK